jgi:hypothetical protein
MGEVSTIGVDIAKSVFQIHGVDADGTVVIRKRVGRAKVPWIRSAPQSGFSMLICRINARRSVSICGRPPRGRDFQRQ